MRPPGASAASVPKPDLGPRTLFRRALSNLRLPLSMAIPAVGFVAGAGFLTLAYSVAATRPPGQLEYTLFWTGELLAVVPAALRLLARGPSRPERLAILVALGLFGFVPMLLRDPTAEIFHDALAHWTAAQEVFHTGKLFRPDTLLHIVQYYPGLSALTVSLRSLTGMSTFQVGTAEIWLLHVTSLIGVFVLVERISGSSRAAGIAGLIYSLNPAFVFFDSQFAYESLAVPLFIWALAAAVILQQRLRQRPHERHAWLRQPVASWLAVGVMASAACIVTHHVTTWALVGTLWLMSAAPVVLRLHSRRARLASWGTAVMAGAITIGAAAWLVLVAPETIAYVAPHVTGGIQGALAILSRRSGGRQLFKSSPLPEYQKLAAFATPVFLSAACAGALWTARRHWRRLPPASVALGALGLLYFGSLPVMLTAQNEGARRSQTFTYLGLAAILAPFLLLLLRRAGGRWALDYLVRAVILLGIVTLLVGNMTLDIDVYYQFPGPSVYGADTRSLSTEVVALATWFRSTLGPGHRVVAPRDLGLALGSYGGQTVSAASYGFPVWQLYFSPQLPSQQLLGELTSSSYGYMAVDTKMYHNLPEVGAYFTAGEPGGGQHIPPLAALNKFAGLPWLTEIYASTHLQVYRLDLQELRACPAAPTVSHALLPGCPVPG